MELKPEMVELGRVTQWLSGGTPSRSIGKYWVGDIPWISAITLKTIEIFESDQCVTEDAVASGSKMAPINSTLLLVRGSALHKEIRAGIVRKPVCFNQDVKSLIPAKIVYPKYLTYSILGREKELLKLVSTAGNTAGVLDTKLVQTVKIWLPEYEEQRAIAAALSDVDALLDGLDRLITKKRNLKQAAMQQLLTGKTRLPGFSGEWEDTSLGQLATLRNGYAFKSSTYTNNGMFRVITIANVQDGRMDLAECNTVTDLPNDLQPHHQLSIGDLLISMTGNVGRVCRVTHSLCLLNQRVGLIYPTAVFSEFLFHLLKQRSFLTSMIGKAKGGAQGNLSKNDILDYTLLVPTDPKEQTAIATVLSDMDAEIAALEARRDKTRNIKQGMMQELLTGKTRLV